jgi:hypothetical protein
MQIAYQLGLKIFIFLDLLMVQGCPLDRAEGEKRVDLVSLWWIG